MEYHPLDNSIPLKAPFNFTPRHGKGRVKMKISAEEREALDHEGRGPGFKGKVKDLDTGKTWGVYGVPGEPCRLPHCCCDMKIMEVKE